MAGGDSENNRTTGLEALKTYQQSLWSKTYIPLRQQTQFPDSVKSFLIPWSVFVAGVSGHRWDERRSAAEGFRTRHAAPMESEDSKEKSNT